MNVNLYINFYVDTNPKRHRELVCCLLDNLTNQSINRIVMYISKEHLQVFNNILNSNKLTTAHQSKVVPIITELRPSYNDYFILTGEYPEDINIIANTDIVFDYMVLEKLKRWNWGNHCLALSRWDFLNDSMSKPYSRHHANRDSQDVWMVKGRFKVIPEANFCLGKRGCDNRIAFLLDKYYDVINPSIDVRTYHYHITGVRNYCMNTQKDVVQPPYKLVIPTKLPR